MRLIIKLDLKFLHANPASDSVNLTNKMIYTEYIMFHEENGCMQRFGVAVHESVFVFVFACNATDVLVHYPKQRATKLRKPHKSSIYVFFY